MNKLDTKTVESLASKLSQMAEVFPIYELDDLFRLNNLLVSNIEIDSLTQEYFFARIDTDDQRFLVELGEICLNQNFINLADCLLRFCLTRSVITNEILEETPLARILLEFVTNYHLSNYVDIERQSSRIKIVYGHGFFSIDLNRLNPARQIQILRLLHESYVQKILDSLDTEQINIEKYNNILAHIWGVNREDLLETRWSRLLAVRSLKYSPKASSKLFVTDLGPVQYDEQILHNFNVLLIPAFGNISFKGHTISIANEGNGAISDPILEITSRDNVLISKNFVGNTLAGEMVDFELTANDLRVLSTLNPNMRNVTLRLSFMKFDSRKFTFLRSVETKEVLYWIRDSAISVSDIRDDRDLFEVVKRFVREIRHVVQEDDGYMSLTVLDGDKRVLRTETEIQISLKHWLGPKCEEYNINLDRESLTGRGPLDFKFSIGSAIKCLMEVKLWHSGKLEHGVEVQLPTYLVSDRTRYGIYVPVIVDQDQYEEKLEKLQQTVRKVNLEKNLEIEVLDIRAWKLESASKAKQVSDVRRY